MRRTTTVLLVALTGATLLTGCGNDRNDCMDRYKKQQRAISGVTPSNAQAREACDRDSSRGFHGGSGYRGGGSGSGK